MFIELGLKPHIFILYLENLLRYKYTIRDNSRIL